MGPVDTRGLGIVGAVGCITVMFLILAVPPAAMTFLGLALQRYVDLGFTKPGFDTFDALYMKFVRFWIVVIVLLMIADFIRSARYRNRLRREADQQQKDRQKDAARVEMKL